MTETTSSTDSVKVSLKIWTVSLKRHVKVNDKFDFGHIKATREKISCNDNSRFLFAELFNHLVSLLVFHPSHYQCYWVLFFYESVEEFYSELSSVNEDNCLSLRFTTSYDVFDKINFRVLITTEVKLLDVVKLQLLLL